MATIGSLGRTFAHPAIRSISMESDENLMDFDIIVWDPLPIYERTLNSAYDYRNFQNLIFPASAYQKFIAEAKARDEEIEKFLEDGRCLVVCPTTVPKMKFQAPGGVVPFDTTGLFPWPEGCLESKQGENMVPAGDDSFRKVLCKALHGNVRYRACFTRPVGSPLLYIHKTEVPVACHEHHANGHILYLPPPPTSDGSQDGRAREEKFIDTILHMLEHLPARPEIGRTDLPGWADRYCLKSEITAHKEIDGFRSQIENLEGEIQTRDETLWAIERRKVLFTGKGPSLEDAVSVALTELGFKVLPGPKSHADLVCCNENQIGVWEIKGRDKPAAIADVNQCNRWVREIAAAQTLSPEERREDSVIGRYAEILREMDVPVRESEDEDVEPLEAKGFILVNTHQAKELSARNNPSEPDFPDNVSKAIKRDGHCAMTGIQLLGVLLAGEESPDERPNLTQKLFDTKTVLKGFSDWTQFLSDPNEGVADASHLLPDKQKG